MPVKDILEISFIIHLQKHINTHKNTSADKKINAHQKNAIKTQCTKELPQHTVQKVLLH